MNQPIKYIRAKAITEDDDGEGSGATLHAITYTDTSMSPHVARQVYPDGIYVGVAGDMDLILLNDTVAVEFKNAIAGTVYPFAFKALHTDSTITNAVALSTGVNVVTRP
jgi:cell division FtsZ-interacting protein ZapD